MKKLLVLAPALLALLSGVAQEHTPTIYPESPVTTQAPSPPVTKATDSDKRSPEERTQAIFQAVETGDTAGVAPLLEALTYYRHNADGETALTLAILRDDEAMVRLLVKDAVINLKNQAGETPLTLAIKRKNPAIIRLVAERAKAGLKNDLGEAPLMLVLEQADLPFIQYLIDHGADVNRKSNGVTPVYRATQLRNIQTLALLLRNGALPGQPNDDGEISLYLAIQRGDAELAGMLLHKSATPERDANWKNAIGETLLNLAIKRQDAAAVRTLLRYGASLTAVDHMENTGLHIAAREGLTEIAALLVEQGADIHQPNIMGYTPTALAARHGHQILADQLALVNTDGASKGLAQTVPAPANQ